MTTAEKSSNSAEFTWNASPVSLKFPPEMIFELGRELHHLANTAYPIGHGQTFSPYRMVSHENEGFLFESYKKERRLGLYVHIPFCERRCRYCEYTVLDRHDRSIEMEYESALMQEFELYAKGLDGQVMTAVGLDIGGGTPTLVRPGLIEKIVTFARHHFRLDPAFSISIETTPKIAALYPEKLEAIRSLGIERISMGVQSASPSLLAEHNRDYNTLDMNLKAASRIRRAGFKKFNIDIMYGFARQSLDDWKNTLRYVIDLAPDYITTYRVRYKGTQVAIDAAGVSLDEINEKYLASHEMLNDAGYEAPPGRNTFSRIKDDCGLSAYLAERVISGTPYIGFGPGAQSFSPTLLCYNLGAATKSMEQYVDALKRGRLPLQDMYFLPKEEAMAKMISVSFYYGAIHLPSFRSLFGVSLREQFPEEVDFLIRKGLMGYQGESFALTPEGALNFNGAIALFYSGSVKSYLNGKSRGGGSGS
jgi:oxygen-independent coproporphyrinogen III oxidase